MQKLRYFIFFYKCKDLVGSTYGHYGYWSESLLSSKFVREQVSKITSAYSTDQVNILGFNEVSKIDYDAFFDKTE